MLPPVLEIYVVWHPDDVAGTDVAQQVIDHFHGTAFSGLIGGAVEVYVRTEGWCDPADAPRPLPFVEPLPHGIPAAQLTAVVPVLGTGLATAVQPGEGPWHGYVAAIVDGHARAPETVGVYPVKVTRAALEGTELEQLLGRFQQIGAPNELDEDAAARRCRDLAQGIAQLAGAGEDDRRLTVFVSHTKRAGDHEERQLGSLIDRVRYVIDRTRLADFFDANDLQPGADWADELRARAATSALLAVRTDRYASREWCQREMATAKQARMPVVILDALSRGEARGSFLMDHVPRIPCHTTTAGVPDDRSILAALDQLVDECLKRRLWDRQAELAQTRDDLGVAWWAAHAPEPVTFARWLAAAVRDRTLPAGPLRVLHPDPPLGPDEVAVLQDIVDAAGIERDLDVLTPRGLAARGA